MFTTFLEKNIPTWYKISATVESLFLLKHKKESVAMLEEAKKTVNSTREMEEWYQKNNFKYFSDKIDLSSLPWVVVSRRGGDCDDFMSLSYEILKTKYECHKVLIYSYDGHAHAILIVKEKDDNTFTILSNYSRVKYFTSLDQAAKHFYGKNTKTVLYLKS